MLRPRPVLPLASCVLIASTAYAQGAGWTTISGFGSASDLNADGTLVVLRGATWTALGGAVPLPDATAGGSTTLAACDATGEIVAGNATAGCASCDVAARYEGSSWTLIDLPDAGCVGNESLATDISGDGNVVVGNVWIDCDDRRPFHWSIGGGLTLLPIGAGVGAQARCVSPDGTLVGGTDFSATTTSNPAIWTDLSQPPTILGQDGTVFAIADDGSTYCGDESSRAAIFRDGQPVEYVPIPASLTGTTSVLLDCDGAGEAFIGHVGQGVEWTPIYHRGDVGTRTIETLALDLGLSDPDFSRTQFGFAISSDGRTLAGSLEGSPSPFTSQDAWVLALPEILMFRSTEALSLSSGGSQALNLFGGSAHASELYLVVGSASGTAPGLPLAEFSLALNPDPYFDFTLANPNSLITGSFGSLDGEGRGVANVTLPAGSDPTLAGTTLHHAAVAIDPATLAISGTSNPHGLELTP